MCLVFSGWNKHRFPSTLQISLFSNKNLEGKSPDGPMLSKAEFVEKVRRSNQACHEGDFHGAIVLYGEALAVDPQNCILYSNRSAAYVKTQQYEEALDDAIQARLLNPKWPKVGKQRGSQRAAPPAPVSWLGFLAHWGKQPVPSPHHQQLNARATAGGTTLPLFLPQPLLNLGERDDGPACKSSPEGATSLLLLKRLDVHV